MYKNLKKKNNLLGFEISAKVSESKLRATEHMPVLIFLPS